MAVNESENLLRESNTKEDILNNVQCCLDPVDFHRMDKKHLHLFLKYHIP